MESTGHNIIAACGLVCNECGIYKATSDPEVAEGVAKWFRENQGVEMKAADVNCEGCRGNREKHWSADCWILKCCVDDHGLENCSQCEEFPCEKTNFDPDLKQRWIQMNTRMKEIGIEAYFEESNKLSRYR